MIIVNKNKELQGMKTFALAVLSLAFAGYVIGTYFHIGVLRAFSEAAMVGGLADWFAVVALFRRPMGLPIPHTALIPNNKDRIGENLGKFVTDEFLTHERLEPKINELDNRLTARINELDNRLTSKIDRLENEVSTRFRSLEFKINPIWIMFVFITSTIIGHFILKSLGLIG